MQDLFDTLDEQQSASLYANQYPMREHPSGRGFIISVPDGELFYAPDFFDQKISDRALQVLLDNDQYDPMTTNWHEIDNLSNIKWHSIEWQQSMIKMFGKEMPLPRLSAWYGDNEKRYTYSGIHLTPLPWNPMLNWIRQQLSEQCDTVFNSVLLNWYRNGDDHISWHTDAERELGINPTIASVNFGETRRFLLRRNDDPQQKIELPLSHGSVLIMSGALQHHWQHSVPKQKAVKKSRINMTFRCIQ